MPQNGMSVSLLASVPSLTTAAPPLGKGEKAARDFEAILLTSLMDSLQKTFSGLPDDQIPGASDYRLMGTQAFAEAIANHGGIGIARLILSYLPTSKVSG